MWSASNLCGQFATGLEAAFFKCPELVGSCREKRERQGVTLGALPLRSVVSSASRYPATNHDSEVCV